MMTGQQADGSESAWLQFLAGVKVEHLVAGVGGGVAATSVLHPLDLLKLRNGSQPALSLCC